MNKITIIENYSEIGAGTRGAALGVDAMKVAALNSKSDFFIKHNTVQIEDSYKLLNIDFLHSRAKRIEYVIDTFNSISVEVYDVLQGYNFPVVLAGDHSSAGGTIAGIKKANPNKKLGVIWIDAHADMHSPYTSPSGNLHGMSLATALDLDNYKNRIFEIDTPTKEKWNELKNIGDISPKLLSEDLVFIALRDTEQPENNYISENNIKVIRVDELRNRGAKTIAEETLNYLTKCDIIYISFDVDSMDPDLVSYGTGTPVKNGLSEQEANTLINSLLESKKVACLELVEINPCLDNKQNTMAETAFRILDSAVSVVENR
jgi:arginase